MNNISNYVIDKIYEHCSGPKNQHHDRINFRCPYCNDSKKSLSKARGWYYFNTESFYCFNCHESDSAYGLLSTLEDCTILEVKKQLFKERILDFDKPNKHVIQPKTIKKIDSIKIPDSWIDYTEHKDTKTIIESRKIFDAPFIPKKWKPYYCTNKNRIVLPWMENDEIVYYQLRKIYKSQSPKYLYPYDTTKNVFITNFDSSFPYLFLHEGLLDAIFCKNSAVIGGINMSNAQLEKIKEYENMGINIVYFLDNNRVDKSSKEMTKKLIDKGQKVFVWDRHIKHKDLNSLYLKEKAIPCVDEQYLMEHTHSGLKALIKLNFR